jgi:hypothetical protein
VSGWLEAGGRHPERVVGSSSPGPEGEWWKRGGVVWLSPQRRSSVCLFGGDAERAP